MDTIKVTLKSGKIIQVLRQEVEGLKKAGLLKESKVKSETKEEKNTGQTKSLKNELEAKEKMYPSARRPANISSANIKGGRPKKVR